VAEHRSFPKTLFPAQTGARPHYLAVGNSAPGLLLVSETSPSSAQSERFSSTYYSGFFLIFRRFSESCDFFLFGVSMPSLRPFCESLISAASRR
jgi:hypothetical protein